MTEELVTPGEDPGSIPSSAANARSSWKKKASHKKPRNAGFFDVAKNGQA
jgi:hypothetical protein